MCSELDIFTVTTTSSKSNLDHVLERNQSLEVSYGAREMCGFALICRVGHAALQLKTKATQTVLKGHLWLVPIMLTNRKPFLSSTCSCCFRFPALPSIDTGAITCSLALLQYRDILWMTTKTHACHNDNFHHQHAETPLSANWETIHER